jgi:3-hydroxyisobutyrate dehydrogenase-like beta-hydroxyacid dehydrogenase
MRVAVLGLGEAGSIYAADLPSRGATVTGTDPRVPAAPPGVAKTPGIPEAVRGADLVLSLVGAEAAAAALTEASPAMAAGSIYADMNTSSPADKRRLAVAAARQDIAFVDVAILAPVPRARIDTPLLLSGAAAGRLAPLLDRLRIPATGVGDEPGAAAQLKLLRSVFMKGLAALVYESVEAAELVGAGEWVTGQISAEFGEGGREIVRHLIEGTEKHAVRREAEMRDVRGLLESLGAQHPMTDGTIEWLRAISARSALPAVE